ncbi:zinc finger protein 182-like [Contarinia nasturtii]|uniref:zinc finger protein 182-like n=1 Tax=Contarinia nasturtii TaxID=265458 RepID=UPI0012D39641|nr:zinc finger protein 182-like [Contarinia nasturtii]
MEQKKKRLKVTPVKDLHRSTVFQLKSSGMSMMHNGIASLIDPDDIKQETYIKEEDPDSVGHLIVVPVLDDSRSQRLRDSNEHDGDYDFELVRVREVKMEPNEEIECKEEQGNEPNTNGDSGEDATNDQENQQAQPDQGRPMSNSVTKNGPKAHKCDLCEYSTNVKSNLKVHSRTHTNERPYGCKYCSKSFITKQRLSYHIKVHVKEFLFHCPGCLQGFNKKEHKMIHIRSCKVRRYECHLCKQSFGSIKSYLFDHVRVHSGHKPFECTKCKEFESH